MPPRTQCLGITQQYLQCSNRAAPGDTEFCRIHRRIEDRAGPKIAGRCHRIGFNKLRCPSPEYADGTCICARHKFLQDRAARIRNQLRNRIQQDQEQTRILSAEMTNLLLDMPVTDVIGLINRMFVDRIIHSGWIRAQVVIDVIRNNYNIYMPDENKPPYPQYLHQMLEFSLNHLAQLQFDLHRERQNAWRHPDADQRDLARLANDRQSVHTTVVSEQTNKGVTALMTFKIPETQNTMVEVEAAWAAYILANPEQGRNVLNDMKRWYGLATCREQNDWLFKKVTDHLWAFIQTSDHKIELIKRFWQESVDSVGMCCDGHINRLVNVLVGFHPAFEPQISTKERLQEGMAKISADESLSEEQKIERAEALMQELQIPEEEQSVWLDAL